MADLRGLNDDTLVASATFGLVPSPRRSRTPTALPETPPVDVTTRTSSPIGGADLNILKDLTAPQAPTSFPAGGRFTSAQSVAITADNEIEDVVRYRVGATEATTADPTAASAVVPNPLPVTTTQTVKARSFDPAGNPSTLASFTYTIAAATPPTAPTGVAATADDGSATLVWRAPTDDGGAPVTSYRIQVFQGLTSTAPFRTINIVDPDETLNPGEYFANVAPLTNGTDYRLRVAALNGVAGTVQYSGLITVTPQGVTVEIPGAPTGVTGVRGDRQATVSWTAPADDGGAAITEYRVQVRTGTTVTRTVTLIPGTATSTVVTGLTNGTAYNFRVRAVNSAGQGSLSAASAAVTPQAAVVVTAPGAPVIGTAAAGVAGGAITATARWTPPTTTGGAAVNGYVVRAYRVTGGAVATTPTSTSTVQAANVRSLVVTFTAAQAGNYRFTVQARNSAGFGAESALSNQVAGR